MNRWWRKGGRKTEHDALRSWLTGMTTLREARPHLLTELRRARRHERPLTLLAFGPNSTGGHEIRRSELNHSSTGIGKSNGGPLDPSRQSRHSRGRSNGNASSAFMVQGPAHHPDLFFAGVLLRGALRESDLVALSVSFAGYAVLLPETGEADGRAAVLRLNDMICQRTSMVPRVGIAAFPQDGLTIEDLLWNAQDAWHHRPVIAEVPDA